ncbi:putative chalcone--flavonone isomerase-like [Capsicum annuum]|nr:putative chalcone--flavonone isomerase-like [Capsicum annuum]
MSSQETGLVSARRVENGLNPQLVYHQNTFPCGAPSPPPNRVGGDPGPKTTRELTGFVDKYDNHYFPHHQQQQGSEFRRQMFGGNGDGSEDDDDEEDDDDDDEDNDDDENDVEGIVAVGNSNSNNNDQSDKVNSEVIASEKTKSISTFGKFFTLYCFDNKELIGSWLELRSDSNDKVNSEVVGSDKSKGVSTFAQKVNNGLNPHLVFNENTFICGPCGPPLPPPSHLVAGDPGPKSTREITGFINKYDNHHHYFHHQPQGADFHRQMFGDDRRDWNLTSLGDGLEEGIVTVENSDNNKDHCDNMNSIVVGSEKARNLTTFGVKEGNVGQSGNEGSVDVRNAVTIASVDGDMYYNQYLQGPEGSNAGQKEMGFENGCEFSGRKEGHYSSESGESLRTILSDPITGDLMDDAMILPCGHSFGSGGVQHVIRMYQASKNIFLPIASTAQSPTFGSWVVDSSASDHISGDKSLLSDIVYSQSLPAITLANGIRTEPKGVGQAKPLSSVTLNSVLYVPGCPFNLVSVSRLTRALDCSITFFDDSFLMQDRKMGQTIGIGHESQGLYHLTASNSFTTCSATDPPNLIHIHLGHPSLSKLQKMVPSLSSLSTLDCESCQLGKHTRATFSRNIESRSESIFSLVLFDIWGPSREFMTHQGIIHQTSCPYTPQQNGIAERKSRHLIETARTLLIESHVPLRFWGDVVLTSCYLINRMPSSSI